MDLPQEKQYIGMLQAIKHISSDPIPNSNDKNEICVDLQNHSDSQFFTTTSTQLQVDNQKVQTDDDMLNNKCYTCAKFRCCLDHCCNWGDCACGDCIECQGTINNEFTQQELLDRNKLREVNQSIQIQNQLQQPLAHIQQSQQQVQVPQIQANNTVTIIADLIIKTQTSNETNKTNIETDQIQNQDIKQDKDNDLSKKDIISKEELDAIRKSLRLGKEANDADAARIINYEDIRFKKVSDMTSAEQKVYVSGLVKSTKSQIDSTLNTISATIASAEQTIRGCQQTQRNIDSFKDRFASTMIKLVDKIGQSQEAKTYLHQNQNVDDMGMAQISDIEEVADILASKSNIMFLTGAGVSQPSNIPTFRGQENCFWNQQQIQTKELQELQLAKAEDILTFSFFSKNPLANWKWIDSFRRLVQDNTPNEVHACISELMRVYGQESKEAYLVTQNIDGYDIQAFEMSQKHNVNYNQKQHYLNINDDAGNESDPNSNSDEQMFQIPKNQFVNGFINMNVKEIKRQQKIIPADYFNNSHQGKIFQIHGNVHYMRCSQNCTNDIYVTPSISSNIQMEERQQQQEQQQQQYTLPMCPKCHQLARPHVLFFDEPYNEEFYSYETVKAVSSCIDALIVIGTSLQTNLANNLVMQAINNQIPIIEINISPSMQVGHVYQLIGPCQSIVPELISLIIKKIS